MEDHSGNKLELIKGWNLRLPKSEVVEELLTIACRKIVLPMVNMMVYNIVEYMME